ncbi:hypothetical protein IFM89_030420 [Coptis chinensis]|uniref:Uncharacterized protein n=1 Tax=Coptis chinensis TaxID=261450 RepID=A0A835M183_9MAGN|nr:hypothetical protein IFM89_030420 [Coptis chinensis]
MHTESSMQQNNRPGISSGSIHPLSQINQHIILAESMHSGLLKTEGKIHGAASSTMDTESSMQQNNRPGVSSGSIHLLSQINQHIILAESIAGQSAEDTTQFLQKAKDYRVVLLKKQKWMQNRSPRWSRRLRLTLCTVS